MDEAGVKIRLAILHEHESVSYSAIALEASLAEIGVSGQVTIHSAAQGEFESAIEALREAGYRGAFIANPHKTAAARMGQKFFLAREAVGVANAMLFESTGIYVRNTEVAALSEIVQDLEPGKALVIGAGQAARSVISALFQHGWKPRVWNRNAMRTRVLQTMFGRYGEIELPSKADAGGCRLVVNASAAGLKIGETVPLEWRTVGPKAVVADLALRRTPTELVREARLRGLRTIDGMDILSRTVSIGVQWFAGQRPEASKIREALAKSLALSRN